MTVGRLWRAIQFFTFIALLLTIVSTSIAAEIPAGFPEFVVPGHDAEMASIRALFWHHYEPAVPLIPLWDAWMPMSTLWPAISPEGLAAMRARWASALSSRPMDAEGYVLTLQHDGLGHAEGWPFPLWTQAGGMGWHFRGTGVKGYDGPVATEDGWTLAGATDQKINDKGWVLSLDAAKATAQTPAFSVKTRVAPWLRLNWWSSGLDGAKCYVEWTTTDQPAFGADRRAYFSPANSNFDGGETRTMIKMIGLAGWEGTITGLRIGFDNKPGAKVVIKSFHTACDTRQTVNNPNFIRGCHDYFLWTGDVAFLQSQIGRIRTAMRYVQREFDTVNRKCLYTTWPGHEGRSGVRYVDGKKVIVQGDGIGSNYWDILPFGGEDALGTIYYFDAVRDLAEIEEQIARHPEWKVTGGAEAFDPAALRKHADEVKAYGQRRFWNPTTGRFGTVDLDGNLHDYGFTFLNDEAVYYGFASAEQAKSIHAWMSGERIVDGDTSTGADIYHWRFGPRSTTKRNLDYYFWAWSDPQSIQFGDQVQDGGAVLGFTFHDLMARLETAGPDDAAARVAQIAKWFDETQAAGGYRAYYNVPGRGSMQGGNTAGGLGLDKEFFESILMPQVMLYGFMGLKPTADGFSLDPKLPGDWPELTITHIALHQHILDITMPRRDGTITVEGSGPADQPIEIGVPTGWKVAAGAGLSVKIVNK